MIDTIEIPICISGGITSTNPSLCLDGATHLIHTPMFGAVRLLATNAQAEKSLIDFEDAKVVVTVCGYPRRSPNCVHLEVFSVSLAETFAPELLSLGDKVGNG